ncbi:MAG: hypothetical protein C0403_09490 [Desulfobacterium sp.]|nr:hypothetical protein [Desulfobacterium sp.]
MITNKKEFGLGMLMIVSFFVVLGIIFMPLFNGHNGLEFFDNLFNSISKGSAYYISDLTKTSEKFNGKAIDLTISYNVKDKDNVDKSAEFAEQAAKQLVALGLEEAVATDKDVTIKGDLGKIVTGILKDADSMYSNKGTEVSDRYNGADHKKVMSTWWETLKLTNRALLKQEKFEEAMFCDKIMKKGVEPAYNFYGIDAQKISANIVIVVSCLVFYVIYTLWYGFAILFLFEGFGLQIGH